MTLLGLDARSVDGQPWSQSPPIGAWQTGFSNPTNPYSFVFDQPVASFGMFVNLVSRPTVATVHLASGATDTVIFPEGPGDAWTVQFFGLAAESNVITRIDFDTSWYHIIDNVQFGRIADAPATDYEVDEGTELTFTTPADDPDVPAQTLTFSLAGAPAGASIDPVTGVFTWTPGEADGPGVFTFDVVVSDDGVPSLDGRRTVTVTVNDVNEGPAAVITGGSTVVEGSSMVLDGGGSSDVDGTIVAYAWSVSAGAVLDDAGRVSPMLTGVDDATVTVTLTVTDDDGATATTTHEVSVSNASPVVAPAGPLEASVGVLFTLPTSFSDAGTLDIHSAVVEWGDGSSDEFAVVSSPFDATHTYSAPGSYTVTVSVTDDDGDVGTVDVVVEVTETLASLVLTPDTAVVGTGVPQAFDVEGFDPLGNSLGDRTAEAVFTISPNGRCTLNVCRSGSTGVKVVTARIGTLTATATLDVRVRQTISFPAIGATTMLDSPVVVSATASSGLPVTFSTTTPDVCSASGADGSTITLLGAGTCTVRADQAGDANWAPAVSVLRNSTVRTVTQSITFPSLTAKLITESPVVVSATASSGLPVTFTTTTPECAPPVAPMARRSRCWLPVRARCELNSRATPCTGRPTRSIGASRCARWPRRSRSRPSAPGPRPSHRSPSRQRRRAVSR